jgi:hypothetical protein
MNSKRDSDGDITSAFLSDIPGGSRLFGEHNCQNSSPGVVNAGLEFRQKFRS